MGINPLYTIHFQDLRFVYMLHVGASRGKYKRKTIHSTDYTFFNFGLVQFFTFFHGCLRYHFFCVINSTLWPNVKILSFILYFTLHLCLLVVQIQCYQNRSNGIMNHKTALSKYNWQMWIDNQPCLQSEPCL